jgi:NADH-quinone oxidoreductase subunit N
MIPAPVLIFSLTLLAAAIVSALRRNHLIAAVITGIFAAVIAFLVLIVPMNEAMSIFGISVRIKSDWIILGRSFVLNETNRNAIGYLYVTGGFLLAGSWTARPVRMFLPLGFGILFLVASSLMIVPFLFAAILIQLAVVAGLLMLTSREVGSYRGGMRLLIFYIFGMFALLLSGWAVDIGGIVSDSSILSERALLLLYFGFAVLLAIPPFHSWIPIASEETHPFAIGFAVLILQGAGFFFFLRFMNTFPWIWADDNNLAILRTVGAILAVLGALWALAQDTITKLGSYAMVSDVGVMLIAIGFGTTAGFQIALGLLAARVIGISCWAIGISIDQGHKSADESEIIQNTKHAGWIPKMAMVVGVASLAGIPLTAGFPGRWGLLQLSAGKGVHLWIAILISMAIIGYSSLKHGFELLNIQSIDSQIGIGPFERLFLWGGIATSVVLGVFPQLLIPWIARTVLGFSSTIP